MVAEELYLVQFLQVARVDNVQGVLHNGQRVVLNLTDRLCEPAANVAHSLMITRALSLFLFLYIHIYK